MEASGLPLPLPNDVSTVFPSTPTSIPLEEADTSTIASMMSLSETEDTISQFSAISSLTDISIDFSDSILPEALDQSTESIESADHSQVSASQSGSCITPLCDTASTSCDEDALNPFANLDVGIFVSEYPDKLSINQDGISVSERNDKSQVVNTLSL